LFGIGRGSLLPLSGVQGACVTVLDRLGSGGGERRTVMRGTEAAHLERAFRSALETIYVMRRGHTQMIRVEKLEI
jgi:hypothetical protein